MENQFKNVMDGTASHGSDQVKVANSRSLRSSFFLLRLLVIAATLAAAVLMGVNKETQNIPLKLGPDLPPIYVPVLAKSSYLSSFKYFVAVNAAVCAYTTLSLLLSMVGKTGKSSLAIVIILLDLVFLVLLSSGIGAGSAVGVLGAKGNTHVGWKKVCNYYGKFCRHVAASLLVSFVGMVGLLLLIILAVLNVYRRR